MAPTSSSEWAWGRTQGRSSSLQDSAALWSRLLDPRTEDAREGEGSRERNRHEGSTGTRRTLWASNSVFVANTYCLHFPEPCWAWSQVCSQPACVHCTLQFTKLFSTVSLTEETLRPLEGARQGLCSPLVQVRKPSPRGKGRVRGRARTQPPPPSSLSVLLFLPDACFSFPQGSQGRRPGHLLHLFAISPSDPAPGSDNNLLHLHNEFTESVFPKCLQLYQL